MAGPAPELRAGPFVFVDDLDVPVIGSDDRHHLQRSLRLGRGDGLCLGDGAGAWRTGSLVGDEVVDLGPVRRAPSPQPAVAVGLAIPRGARLDVAIAKLTELGVDQVLLVATERSVVRWPDAEVARRLDRLRRVAREAAMQARRLRLPEIAGVVPVGEVVRSGSGTVALAEPGGGAPGPSLEAILVGPEGGWAPGELAACETRVELGPTVLRVETAAIAAGVLLCGRRDGWLR